MCIRDRSSVDTPLFPSAKPFWYKALSIQYALRRLGDRWVTLDGVASVSYTHLRAHETGAYL
eukprot:5743395-Pyramimonas_sp.AAC.1